QAAQRDISIVTPNMAARDPDGDLSKTTVAASVTSRGRLNLPYYKMDADPRGICLIINNHSFYRESKASAQSLDAREGTDVDRGHVELQADAEERDRLRLIPNEADFLVSYATVPGYVHEIGDILTRVKFEVGDRSTVRLQYKQAPVEMNALRKKLVFGQIHSQTSSASVPARKQTGKGAAVTEPSRSEDTVGNKGEKPRPPEPKKKRTGESVPVTEMPKSETTLGNTRVEPRPSAVRMASPTRLSIMADDDESEDEYDGSSGEEWKEEVVNISEQKEVQSSQRQSEEEEDGRDFACDCEEEEEEDKCTEAEKTTKKVEEAFQVPDARVH
ncbi:hypothetical protein BaRGS_00029218, partial [Batillaria attramentaria]